MIDLEERLRDELLRTAQGFEPSVDLRERIGARIERRTHRNRQLLAAAAVVVAVAAVAGGVVTMGGDRDPGGVVTEPEPETTTTTEREPASTTTSSSPTTSVDPDVTATTVPPPDNSGETTTTSAPTPEIDDDTPLSRWGVGPIRAGMTIPEAEAAAGVRLVIDPGAWESFGRTCGVFTLEGTPLSEPGALVFVARTPGLVPNDDPRVAVIDAVGGAVTDDGIAQGDPVEDVYAQYGQPTRTDAGDLAPDSDPTSQVLLYDEGEYTYGFRTEGGAVQAIRSGHVRDLGEFEPCA